MSTSVLESASPTELDAALDVFLAQRTRLIQIAHRVTGDFSGAEDVVQDAWLRWQHADRGVIRNPAAFLTTTTTRLAINVVQSARHRHEATTAAPLANVADTAEDQVLRAERTAALEKSLRVLMARLSPGKLAAYLLRKGFDYPYGELARLMNTSSANVRQVVLRAQQRIEGDRERPVDREDHRRVVAAFQAAARTGDLAALEALLPCAAWPSTRGREQRPGAGARRPRPARAA
ncbi:sigma factor [Promicromonospora sp. NPDC057138]|uniref:sigma factor n=1 Tax=Promicromonospora sp. NPDC057138 TaxID=3346031 RepID=UPI00363D97B5